MKEEGCLVTWANPMLKVPELAAMSGKSATWIREQLRCEDPIPHTRPGEGAQPLVLWSDYVAWFKRKFGVTGCAEEPPKERESPRLRLVR